MKRFLKVFGIFFIVVLAGVGFAGCKPKLKGSPSYRYVRAFVEEEYNDKFDALGFKLEDFELSNAESFECYYNVSSYWGKDAEGNDIYITDENVWVYRHFLIKLKKTGKKQADKAIKSLEKLEFIKNAEYDYVIFPDFKSE